MTCTNCFGGCVETTSDKCVKYTGNDITFLNIHTGDTLLSVEEAITDYLATVLTGVGIIPTIERNTICDIVKQYLPCEECGSPTLLDILAAIIHAICDLEAEIIIERERIDVIEGEYDVKCLTVDGSAGTHSVLQEVITSLCKAIGDIETLNNLFETCITEDNINSYIQNYINTTTNSDMSGKMVPYVIYPFYPTNAVMSGAFDINGVGIGTWKNIYLCNGWGGKTPDLRGRSLIGTTTMGGGVFNSQVDPANGNPSYSLGSLNGQNSVVLDASQMAAHTHIGHANVIDPGHNTKIRGSATDTSSYGPPGPGHCDYPLTDIEGAAPHGRDCAVEDFTATTIGNDKTNITVNITNDANAGGGNGHTNIHPVLACYYVMYVPV